jgi:HAD superfamily hydrolase (TIGR01509 family)
LNLLKNFNAQAIIFDKDGTLIDFDAMWGGWTLQIADRLQAVMGLDSREALCAVYGYDNARKKILPDGKLTCTPMWRLRELLVEVARSLGLPEEEALSAVEQAWVVPDPVALAKPFTDIRALFENIHRAGIKIAVATTDDRAPTEAMLDAFNVTELVATMVCADDGIPAKPAPDMVAAICARLNVAPSKTIVIGDTTADLRMARSAGAGLVIGVLSGVGSLEKLTPLADILIDTIDTMQASFSLKEIPAPAAPLEDLDRLVGRDPNLAF